MRRVMSWTEATSEPCGGALDGIFEVFGEATVSIEPCEGALDDPAPG